MPEPVRLLCTGDIHLGRCPSCIDPDRRELTAAHVWDRFVQEAVDRRVDAVVLTGDTVDEDNKVFEAMSALEKGVRRLVREEIEVVAVAGNHDYDAFPRLLRNLGDVPVRFLGRGGQWDTYTLEQDGTPCVRFVGWSFPRRHVHASPLEELSLGDENVPTLGVLHCDVDQMDSTYAPVSRRQLGRASVEGWLMGHIHRAEAHYDDRQLQLYAGSLQPLHPNEPGDHGAWLVEVGAGGGVRAEPVSIASLCYDAVHVGVADCEAIEDVEETAADAVRTKLKQAAEKLPHLEHAVFRVVFAGRTALGRAIDQWAPGFIEEFETSYEDASVSLDAYTLELKTRHDLVQLAESPDPPGVVARLLLDLRRGNDSKLVRDARQRAKEALRSVHRAPGYEPLLREHDSADLPGDEALHQMMMHRGQLLLDELLNQHDMDGHA